MPEPRYTQPFSQVVWNNAATGANVTSPATGVRVWDSPYLSVYGTVSAACTITVYYSNDGANFYASQNKQVLAGAGNFAIDFITGAEYVALQSSANVTATAIISAKG